MLSALQTSSDTELYGYKYTHLAPVLRGERLGSYFYHPIHTHSFCQTCMIKVVHHMATSPIVYTHTTPVLQEEGLGHVCKFHANVHQPITV